MTPLPLMQPPRALTDRAEPAPPREERQAWNPLFDHPVARARSSYHAPGERLRRGPLQQAHAGLRAHVLDSRFPCVGARSAFQRGRYRYGLYPPLASAAAAWGLCHDLYEFSHEFERPGDDPVTFVALFGGPRHGETGFEQALWRQLQRMHGIDSRLFGWDGRVSSDPSSAEFSFSLGGRAFFVVGLHPRASRAARRSPVAALVFNLHEQFESLREHGKYTRMQDVIRHRDLALQGSLNPVLQTFGEGSQARQYSGRAIGAGWQCPFRPLPSP